MRLLLLLSLACLDRDLLRRLIRGQLEPVRACYQRALEAEPGLGGTLTVTFTVGAGGAVTAAAVARSALDSPRLEACVLRAVRAWRFPKPPGGGIITITYPFRFAPAP